MARGRFWLAMLAFGGLATGAGGEPVAGTSSSSQAAGHPEATTRIEQKPARAGLHPSLACRNGCRVLHVTLKLRKDAAASDERIVESLRDLTWFTHIILKTTSWQESPDAIRNPLVQRAVRICRERRIPVVWGRWLWVGWPDPGAGVPNAESHLDPTYYAAAIARVKVEALALGTVGSCLDAEPYGQGPQKPIKHKVVRDRERAQMAEAVRSAVATAGPVDLIFPTSSGRPSHFAWPLTALGLLRCDGKTYYTKGPKDGWPKVRPAPGHVHRIDLWGCNVGLGRPGDHVEGQVKLTAKDVKALDWDAIRKRYPDCRGVWVYVDYDILPEVIRTWGE